MALSACALSETPAQRLVSSPVIQERPEPGNRRGFPWLTGRRQAIPCLFTGLAANRRRLTNSDRTRDIPMTDFAAARRMMVDGQIRTSDVTDLRLIAAMLELPRERFVPQSRAELAYLDLDLQVSEGAAGAPPRRLLKPMVLAKLLQAAAVQETDDVLDVGCATGYSSAVLAKLARSVVALEPDPTLARHARENLSGVQASNATVETGPLVEGWASRAPYDVIMLGGATEVPPQALFRQLKEGGRLVTILGRTPNARAMLYRCAGGDVTGRPIFDAAASTLPGFAAPPAFVF